MPSSAIREISHDAVTDTLFVTFVDGDLYAYLDVPPAVFRSFRDAPSKGRFFARKIRGSYAYRPLQRPADAASP